MASEKNSDEGMAMGTDAESESGALSEEKLRICSFESRRSEEMASLIERMGGVPTIAPSMREIPLSDNLQAFTFGEKLLAGDYRLMIFLTGVGAKSLLEVLESKFERAKLLQAWDACVTIVRGPKPHAVLREWGVHVDARAPEPNTWRELIETIDAWGEVRGVSIAVQEYGQPNESLYAALEERGAIVTRVPVYRWALPENIEPLKAAVHQCIAGQFDVLLWTSAQQIHHVLSVAESLGKREEFLRSAKKCVIGSIGPTATETLIEAGLPPDLEPEHPKMGPLVKLVCEAGSAIVALKRSAV